MHNQTVYYIMCPYKTQFLFRYFAGFFPPEIVEKMHPGKIVHHAYSKPISFVRTKETGFRSQRKTAGGFQAAVIPAGMTDSPASGRVRLSRGTQFPLENPLALRGGRKFFLWNPGCLLLCGCCCKFFLFFRRKNAPRRGAFCSYRI